MPLPWGIWPINCKPFAFKGKEVSKVSLNKKTFTFIETYSPIFNEPQEVVKILKIAHNITDFIDEQPKEAAKGKKRKSPNAEA